MTGLIDKAAEDFLIMFPSFNSKIGQSTQKKKN